jgi:hypothetical protein
MFLQRKRVQFFWFTFLAIFVWEWFPEYIAPYVHSSASFSLIILHITISFSSKNRTLTGISIFCLAKRDSAWFTRIFGTQILYNLLIQISSRHDITGGAAGNEGLGVFSICLDWNYVGPGGPIGALFTPLSTQLSLYGGTVLCM